MTQNSIEELMIQALLHFQENETFPLTLLEKLTEVTSRERGTRHCASMAPYRILGRIQQGEYLEAFSDLEETLTRHSDEIETLYHLQRSFHQIANAVEQKARLNPLMEGLAEIYEKLLASGMVSLRLHAALLRRYRLLGDSRRARELERKIRRVAPHLIDLADEKRPRPSVPEGAPPERSLTSDREILSQFEGIQEILAFDWPEQSQTALQKINLLLERGDLSETNRDFIRYQKAIALDYLGNPLDALLILSELTERWPTHLAYARSFQIVIECPRDARTA